MENQDSLASKFHRVQMLYHRVQAYNYFSSGPMANPSRGQGRVLSILKIKPEISQKELGYLLEMRNQSLGELLGKLEAKGYITRTPSEEDRRTMNIKLTEEGLAAANGIDTARCDLDDIFDGLSDEEQLSFEKILDRLAAELQERLKGMEEKGHPLDYLKRFRREACGPDYDREPRRPHGEMGGMQPHEMWGRRNPFDKGEDE